MLDNLIFFFSGFTVGCVLHEIATKNVLTPGAVEIFCAFIKLHCKEPKEMLEKFRSFIGLYYEDPQIFTDIVESQRRK